MQLYFIVIDYAFQVLYILIFASILISYLPRHHHRHPLVAGIYRLTEPLYRPLRPFTQHIPGPFDFTPMICIFIIHLIHRFLLLNF